VPPIALSDDQTGGLQLYPIELSATYMQHALGNAYEHWPNDLTGGYHIRMSDAHPSPDLAISMTIRRAGQSLC
jgi:hypothetical protein